MIGRTLRHFRITEQLGQGGMGEVYRAEDTRLGRDVAVKILPEAFIADPQRLARLEREARALAMLTHPNVAAIHEVGEEEGVHFLVMELVEGDSLAQRLERGALPLGESLSVARQIAEALEAAHGRGIVHRDLKPANVMLDPDGRVKLLDFGLAKVLATGPDGTGLAESPTLAYAPTSAGAVLGTAPYMSPEQARGTAAGEQSDIWALGCVLYEMLTGRRAFGGDTAGDVLAAVLEREPSWEALPTDTPPLVRSILRRCLQKDGRRRFHDVADVRIELEEVSREPPAGAPATPGRSRSPPALAWALVGVLLVALASLAWWSLATPGASAPAGLARFHLQPPPGVEAINPTGERAGVEPGLAVSPDGRLVAFRGWDREGAGSRLYLRAVDELEARPVTGTEDGYNPFFSPDSEWLGFFARGAVRKVALAGGEPRTLYETDKLRGATWGEDEKILLGGQAGLVRISADGGRSEQLTEIDEEGSVIDHYWPHLLPGGRLALFQVHGGMGETHHEVALLSLETAEYRTLVQGASYPRYARGFLVFSRLGTLHAAPFDAVGGTIGGEARPIVGDVFFTPGSYRVAYDLASTGALVYRTGAPRIGESRLLLVDRDGTASPLAERRAAYRGGGFPVSPDGERLAIVIYTGVEEMDLWVYDLRREIWTALTFDGAYKSNPVWTPDGSSIVFTSSPEGAPMLYRIPADGSGPPERLTEGPKWDFSHAVSPDGRTVLFERGTAGWDLYILDLRGGGPAEPWLQTAIDERTATFSPDGRWIAYEALRSGQWTVWARPYPGPGTPVRISTEGVHGPTANPRWSPAGGEIFFRCGDGLCVVPVETETGEELRVGREQTLFGLGPDLDRFSFEVSRDGQRFYFLSVAEEVATDRRIVYAPRWTDELAAGK